MDGASRLYMVRLIPYSHTNSHARPHVGVPCHKLGAVTSFTFRSHRPRDLRLQKFLMETAIEIQHRN